MQAAEEGFLAAKDVMSMTPRGWMGSSQRKTARHYVVFERIRSLRCSLGLDATRRHLHGSCFLSVAIPSMGPFPPFLSVCLNLTVSPGAIVRFKMPVG